MPIDINLLRVEKGGNPEAVKASQRKRGGQKAVDLVDQVMTLDQEWIKGIQVTLNKLARFQADAINKEINAIGKQIAPLAKAKKLDSPEAQALRDQKADLEIKKSQLNAECDEKEKLLNSKLNLIGNIVHESCVDSKDERDNERVRLWWPEGRSEEVEQAKRKAMIGKDGKGVPGLYSHHEVLEKIEGYDPVRGMPLRRCPLSRCQCGWTSWLFLDWSGCRFQSGLDPVRSRLSCKTRIQKDLDSFLYET